MEPAELLPAVDYWPARALLTAVELNQIVDALAFEHGSTVGASY